MNQDEREGYTPQSRREQLIATARTLAIYSAWALLALGIIWVLFHLPPGVSRFISAIFRVLSAFS